MKAPFFGVLAFSLFAWGCGGDDDATASAGHCADTSKVLAFPTPAWHKSALLEPPANDFAVAMVAEVKPEWAAQLSLVDGWPARPTLVLPLDAPASSVDATQLRLFGAQGSDAMTDLGSVLSAVLSEEGTTLVVQPRDPVPPGVTVHSFTFG